MVILAAWLSRKIQSPLLAAALGVVLIAVAIYGLTKDQMPTWMGVVVIVVGVMNVMRLLPEKGEPAADARSRGDIRAT